jgi:hypothetical protein
MKWPRTLRVLGTAALIACPLPAAARPDVTLWVVQPPGELVAFDLSDFSRVGGVRIPPAAFNDPHRLAVNGASQILTELGDGQLWIWDGSSAATLPSVPRSPRVEATAGRPSASIWQWLIGDDGSSLYSLDGTSRQDQEFGIDTATTPLHVRETDLAQRVRSTVFAGLSGACQDHAMLSDLRVPCPDPQLWAPGGVVRDFFVLFQCEQLVYPGFSDGMVPSADCHLTLWARAARGWKPTEIGNRGSWTLLDAIAGGTSWIQADEDDGCCGHENGSSNQTVFANTDTSVVLFDEWPRFNNQSYEVSFFTANARIAPGSRRVAFTVHATAGAASELRESSEGHSDSLALAGIVGRWRSFRSWRLTRCIPASARSNFSCSLTQNSSAGRARLRLWWLSTGDS